MTKMGLPTKIAPAMVACHCYCASTPPHHGGSLSGLLGGSLICPSQCIDPPTWLNLHVLTRTALDPEDPAYLEVALAVADLHVQAGDAAAAHAVMQAVHAALQQVGSHPCQALQTGI